MMRSLQIALIAIVFSVSAVGQSPVERPNLNDERFEDRIREGYAPVSGPEPVISDIDREILEKVYSLLDTNPQYAYSFIQDTMNSGAPVSAAFNLALGNIYFRNGNYFQAETQFLAAVSKHPTFRRAWNALGLTRYQQSDYEGAALALSNSIRYGANDATTYGVLGYCHLQNGRYRSAETAYDFAILFDPEETDWAEGIAEVYYETGRYEEAIAVFDNLIRTQPENNEYWLLKANAWLELEKPLNSARCIEIARRIGDVDVESLYLLGNVYLEQGIFHQAREVFVAASSKSGELDQQELLQAIRYLVFNDQHEFAEEIFALVETEGEAWPASDKKLYRFLRAEFAYFDGDVEGSEAAYLHGLEIDPFNGYALLKLADIKVRQGEVEQSIVYFDRAATDPKSRYTALVSKAMALIHDERYRYALNTIEDALAEKSDERLNRLHAQVKRVVENGETEVVGN